MTYDEMLEIIKRPAVYGLMTLDKCSAISASDGEPHPYFLEDGWTFQPDVGYLDEYGVIATAYYNEEVVFYPDWR